MMSNHIIKLLVLFLLLANSCFATVEIIPEYNEQTIFPLNENFRKLEDSAINYLKDRGDATAVDFAMAALTTDNTWRDLDLSAIVPKGAKAVLLYVKITDNAAESLLSFRKNGNYAAYNMSTIATQVANVSVYADVFVFVDKDAKIEYRGSNLAFTDISIVVKGWFK